MRFPAAYPRCVLSAVLGLAAAVAPIAAAARAIAANTTAPTTPPPVIEAPTSPALVKVSLALNWKPEPQFGGFYVGEFTGTYSKHHLDVRILPGGSGTPTVQMVGAGTVEFGIVSADELLIAREHGNDVVALFATFQDCPQGLMVRTSRGFTSIGDIFTHPGTVAMQKGLPYARLLKRKYGFDQVNVVPSPGGDITAFRNDPAFAQQVFLTSEPLVAQKAGIATRTFLVKEIGYNPYTTVLITRRAYLEQNPAVVRDMVAAVQEGWRAYLDDPSVTNRLIQQRNPAMDLETFAASAAAQRPLIENEETARLGLGAMTAQRWTALARQLAELRDIKSAPRAQDCYVWPSK